LCWQAHGDFLTTAEEDFAQAVRDLGLTLPPCALQSAYEEFAARIPGTMIFEVWVESLIEGQVVKFIANRPDVELSELADQVTESRIVLAFLSLYADCTAVDFFSASFKNRCSTMITLYKHHDPEQQHLIASSA
jgi:hypothetical protein